MAILDFNGLNMDLMFPIEKLLIAVKLFGCLLNWSFSKNYLSGNIGEVEIEREEY